MVALLASACSGIPGESRQQALSAVYERDEQALRETLASDPSLSSGDSAVLLLAAASCDSELAEMLVGEFGFDPGETMTSGSGVIFVSVYSEEPSNVYHSDCPESEVASSIQLYLSKGASPCVGPSDSPELVPATRASDWGASERIQRLLANAAEC